MHKQRIVMPCYAIYLLSYLCVHFFFPISNHIRICLYCNLIDVSLLFFCADCGVEKKLVEYFSFCVLFVFIIALINISNGWLHYLQMGYLIYVPATFFSRLAINAIATILLLARKCISKIGPI